MNLTTVDDPIQRKFLPSFLRGVAEENKLITSPNFVVTQALVALLADKGARLKPACDKADVEKRGLYIKCIQVLLWKRINDLCHRMTFSTRLMWQYF